MANIKISQLTEATTLAGTEEVPVNAGGTTKKVGVDTLVPFETLDANGDVGAGAAQVAAGDHDHDGDYADAAHTHTESQITDLGVYAEHYLYDGADSYDGLAGRVFIGNVDPSTLTTMQAGDIWLDTSN